MLTWIIAGVGIPTIAIVVHLLGGTAQATVGDADAVRDRYRRDVAGAQPGAVVVDPEGRAALVEDPELGVAAVVAVGDGLVTRPLGPAASAVRVDGGLRVVPGDLLLGPFTVGMSAGEAADWARRIAAGAGATPSVATGGAHGA